MSILLPLRGLNREPLRRVAAVVCLGWLGASPLLAQAPASNGAAAQATAAEPAAPQAVSVRPSNSTRVGGSYEEPR